MPHAAVLVVEVEQQDAIEFMATAWITDELEADVPMCDPAPTVHAEWLVAMHHALLPGHLINPSLDDLSTADRRPTERAVVIDGIATKQRRDLVARA